MFNIWNIRFWLRNHCEHLSMIWMDTSITLEKRFGWVIKANIEHRTHNDIFFHSALITSTKRDERECLCVREREIWITISCICQMCVHVWWEKPMCFSAIEWESWRVPLFGYRKLKILTNWCSAVCIHILCVEHWNIIEQFTMLMHTKTKRVILKTEFIIRNRIISPQSH